MPCFSNYMKEDKHFPVPRCGKHETVGNVMSVRFETERHLQQKERI